MTENTYKVTVKPEGRKPFTCEVSAPDEWKARTQAMIAYTNVPGDQRGGNLSGEFVDYDVTQL